VPGPLTWGGLVVICIALNIIQKGSELKEEAEKEEKDKDGNDEE